MKKAALLILLIGLLGSAWGTMAPDAATEILCTTTCSGTHTPVGTPAGVYISVIVDTAITDTMGTCDYGGTDVPFVRFEANDGTEDGAVHIYYLGASGIPIGAQTAACTVNSGTQAKQMVVATITAGDVTSVIDTCAVAGVADDPSCTITVASGASYGFGSVWSSINALGNMGAGSGFTGMFTEDFGTSTTYTERSTSELASGNLAVAVTTIPTTAEHMLVGLAVREGAGGAPAAARRRIVIQ